jgi:hypothetical protein
VLLLGLSLLAFAAASCGSCSAFSLGDGEAVARHVEARAEAGVMTLQVDEVLKATGEGVWGYAATHGLDHRRAVVVDAWLKGPAGWKRAAFADAADAEERFDAFAETLHRGSWPEDEPEGPLRPGDKKPWELRPEPALLVSRESDGVSVRVAAPASVSRVKVRLILKVASEPVGGAWAFDLPRLEGELPARVRVVGAPGFRWASQWGDGRPGSRVLLDEPKRLLLYSDEGPLLRGRFGHWQLPEVKAPTGEEDPESEAIVARAELDLPAQLTENPDPVAFVFVVDHSVSAGPDALAGAAALMARVLERAPPESRYALVSFARLPKVLVPAWTDAASREPLEAYGDHMKRANGSSVLAALELAQGMAADTPPELTPRIVLISDAAYADAVTDPLLTARLAAGPLTHVVATRGSAGLGAWSRTFPEDDILAAGPEATGGVWVDADVGAVGDGLPLYLVRPTRLDRPAVLAFGGRDDGSRGGVALGRESDDVLQVLSFGSAIAGAAPRDLEEGYMPAWLAEGEGVRLDALLHGWATDGGPADAVATGYLWAERVEIPLHDDERTRGLGTALAATNELSDELSDAALRVVAERAHAVSRVTSLLQLPDWRPPPAQMGGLGLCGCGCCGGCGGSSYSTSCKAGLGVRHDWQTEVRLLEEVLRRSRERCGALPTGGPRADDAREWLAVELGDHEILDVERAGARDSEVTDCYREVLWALRLDEEPSLAAGRWVPHRTLQVTLP